MPGTPYNQGFRICLLLPSILRNTAYKNALTDPHTSVPIKTEYAVHNSILDIIASFSFERLKTGIIVTSNTFPAPKNLFSEIKNLDCSAIEMESAGIFKAADYFQTPVLTLRAISNLLDEDGNDLGTDPNALTICAERLAQCLNQLIAHSANLEVHARLKQQQCVQEIIDKYHLAQHPEGGWYRRTFQSSDRVKGEGETLKRYKGESRSAGTSIIYLLAQGDFSGWHIVQSDETWVFHEGDSLLLRVIDPESNELQEIVLGLESENLQFTVKAGHVFSAETRGRLSVVGCLVTPGFDFKDFKLLTETDFLKNYSKHAHLAYLIRKKPCVPGDPLTTHKTTSSLCLTF